MALRTTAQPEAWEWEQALALYRRAFDREGRKPDSILAGMFEKGMAFLHLETAGSGEAAAMAVSGVIPQARVLLIDYLAVREELRGTGVGRRFVTDIAEWAKEVQGLRGLILEAEADPGPANERRVRFWERCGFKATSYIHKYVWVPETYRALYLPLTRHFRVTDAGESLFGYIEWFHKKSFAR